MPLHSFRRLKIGNSHEYWAEVCKSDNFQWITVEPGSDMLHMNIKKLPLFDRHGHRITNNRPQNTRGAGYECFHICIDDHSH